MITRALECIAAFDVGICDLHRSHMRSAIQGVKNKYMFRSATLSCRANYPKRAAEVAVLPVPVMAHILILS